MVAPSKYMGHHVAGSLAARHGIHVQLEPAAIWGIVATVDLPPEVVDGPVTQPTQPEPAGFFPSLTAAPVAGLAAAPDESDPNDPTEG